MRSRTISIAVKIVVLSFVLSAIAHPLFAEDFTVNVPIDLKNLPPTVTKGFVQATAVFITGSNQYMIGSSTMLYFDIVGGNYSNTIVLKFNAYAGKDPNLVNHLSAGLWLHKGTNGEFYHPSILFQKGSPFSEIDETQPFREISIIPIVNP